MIPLKTFNKNCTIELVLRLFKRLYTKGVHSRLIMDSGAIEKVPQIFYIAIIA
jgi:hypothetical protein